MENVGKENTFKQVGLWKERTLLVIIRRLKREPEIRRK